MGNLFARLFIKDYKNTTNTKVRNAYGTMASIFGLFCNAVLSAIKITVGAIFGSVAMLADGMNNLTDMTSSGISLVSFRMSNKPADSKHPYGHARMEYVASLIIAIIIIVVGVQLSVSSVQSILSKNVPNMSNLVLIFLAVSIVVKSYMAIFYHRIAKQINSSALKAVCIDSINDVIATTVVLISSIVTKYTGVNLDGYTGVLVSIYIFVAGIKLAKETLSPILGEKPDKELIECIVKKVKEYPAVLGIHDVIAHNYGANKYFVTFHAEVDSEVNILESHELIDDIENDLTTENVKVVIHMDPIVTNDEVTNSYKELIAEILKDIDPQLHFHDFRVVIGHHRNNLIFDVACDSNGYTEEFLRAAISKRLFDIDSKCRAVIKLDTYYIDPEVEC